MKFASDVITHLTQKHFSAKHEHHDPSVSLPKKYLFFYIAHDLIFKTKDRQMTVQIYESDSKQRQEVEVTNLAYIAAIGDVLQTWTSYLCLDLNEQDYVRLNEVLNILEIWDSNYIYDKKFLNGLRLYIQPQFEMAKDRFVTNQVFEGKSQIEEADFMENMNLKQTVED